MSNDMRKMQSIRIKAKEYFYTAGGRYTTWLNLTHSWYEHSKKNKLFLPLFIVARFRLKHYGYKYSFDISYRAQIGKGLRIAHFGYIVVPSGTILGNHVCLRPGVVIGKRDVNLEIGRGTVVGNYVEFGVGSKIMGPVTIGDNVIIGANAVVTHDIPSNCVVAGVPARIIRKLKPREQ